MHMQEKKIQKTKKRSYFSSQKVQKQKDFQNKGVYVMKQHHPKPWNRRIENKNKKLLFRY